MKKGEGRRNKVVILESRGRMKDGMDKRTKKRKSNNKTLKNKYAYIINVWRKKERIKELYY